MQPHLATLRFEEGLMLCKLRCMIYAPLSQTHSTLLHAAQTCLGALIYIEKIVVFNALGK